MEEKQTPNTVFLPVTVKKRIAVYHAKEKLICGNSLYAIRFDFDSEWASYHTKTAQFRYRKEDGEWVKHATLFDGTDCPVPPIPYAKILYIGVYAGDITTSTEAGVPCLLSALSHGGEPEEPETNVYNQIMEKLNATEELLKDYPETVQAASEAVRFTPMDLNDDQKRTARENIDAANEISVTATGEEIVITDAAEQPLRDLSIIGKSRQIQTPSHDAHATISSVGAVGYTEINFNDEFFRFPSVDGGLRGIPVDDGGNYTDESGQQWVSDEIRYTNNRAVHTRRIGRIVLDGNSAVRYDDATRCFIITIDGLSSPSSTCLCNAFVGSAKNPNAFDIAVISGGLMIQGTVFNEDDDALRQYLTTQAAIGTPVEVIYILSEPVETVLPMDVDYLEYLVLTDEENVIFSGEGAGLSVEYIADTKKYVDQRGGGGGSESGGVSKEQFEQLSEMVAEQQTALDAMSIEGMERTGDWVDVTTHAVEHKGAYATGGVGGIITEAVSSAYDYYVMSVSAGEKYRIEGVYSKYIYGLYLVNSSNTVVERYPEANENGLTKLENEITIPDGVVSIYVNQKLGSYADNTFAVKIERMNASGLRFVWSENTTHDWLYGKKLACVGDSITEASNPEGGYFKNYAEIVADRHGMTVYKDGKGGSTMANVSDHRPFCVDRYTNVPSDFDILTIWFGWNDASYSEIGTIDSTEDTTYYGAYKKVLDYFITTYPTKKIGLIVPYGNSSVDPFREAVRKLSEVYGVPCLDLADGKQCSLLWGTANSAQEARRAALTYDSTHPNQTGHEYLATMYEAFIQRL